MVSLEQNILLQGDTCHLVILDQHVLPDSFNRILLLGTWQGCKIDLSKRAFSKLANDLKVLKFDIARFSLLQSGCSFAIILDLSKYVLRSTAYISGLLKSKLVIIHSNFD